MRRIITIVGLFLVCVVGGYLGLFKREAVADMADSARGYPRAKTPQECVDLFKKAVAARKYDKAAKYCTREYAEQLTRSAAAAGELGAAIDDLNYRLGQDGVTTSELDLVLFYHDPLPPRLTLTLKTTGESEATAVLGVSEPKLQTHYPSAWEIDVRFAKALYAYVPGTVRVVKEGDQWKLDVPVAPDQRVQVDTLIANHKDYVNAFKKVAEEVRTDRTTKLEVEKRFKELLSEAIRAKK
jgi:hypothetical protein